MRPTILLAVLLVPAVAWPCSGASCEALVVPVPASGATIPQNAPAVGFQDSLFSESMWDGGVELQRGAVTAVQLSRVGGGTPALLPVASDDGKFLSPSGGFTAGDAWQLASGGSFCASDAGFSVGPAAALPSSSAVISLAALQVVDVQNPGFCGGATGVIQFALLRIDPATEMLPWLPLARWELEVDGVNWSTSAYGRVPPAGLTGVPIDALHPIDVFHGQCQLVGNDGGVSSDTRVGPGVHSARLLARIAGVSAPVASNTLSVNLDCVTTSLDGGGPPDASVPGDGGCVEDLDAGFFCGSDAGVLPSDGGFVDAGTPDASISPLDGGASSDAGGASDAGTTADGGSEPVPGPTGCGCTGAPLFPLVGVLAVWLSRRRRSVVTASR